MAALDTDPVMADERRPRGIPWGRLASVEAFIAVLILVLALRSLLVGWFASPRVLDLLTVFVGIVMQALPYVVFGLVVAASASAFGPTLDRMLPQAGAAATVPVAAVAGVALPTGADGAVPAAAAQARRGLSPAVIVAYVCSAPSIGPVALVATAVAFPGHAEMVGARLLAGVLTAAAMGWLWLYLGRPVALNPTTVREPARGWAGFWAAVRRDTVRAAGLLVVGAFVVALVTVSMPPWWLAAIAGSGAFAVVALALLGVLLSVGAEAGAFVAAALAQFSLTARLALMVAGPVADLRVFAAQSRTFGPSVALRFAPAAFVLAVGVSALVGWALL